MDWLSSAASLAQVGGDLLGWEGQKDFARENRRFQARREDSAIQRRVADLEAAGLNPMLAYGGAAAASASAAQPSMTSPSTSMLAGASAAKMRAETELLSTQKENIQAHTQQLLASAGQARAQEALLRVEAPRVLAATEHLRTEADLNRAKEALTSLERDKLEKILPSLVMYERAKAAQRSVGMGTVEALNEVEQAWFRFLEDFAHRIRGGVSSAAGVSRDDGIPPIRVPNWRSR